MVRKSLLTMLLFCLAIDPASSSPNEQLVAFRAGTQMVVGTLTLPVQTRPAIVLMLHGFAGNRDEDDIFPRAAAAFAASGLASLRIDFRGAGHSDGVFADTTFSGQVEDALAALKFITTSGNFDPKDVGVLGVSQGGMIAAIASARSGLPQALALWSPVADPPATYSHILGKDEIDKGLLSGRQGVVAAGLRLRQPFFEEVYNTFPLREIKAYKGALFVVEGDFDDVVGPDTGEKYVAAHGGGQVWRGRMDHDFNLAQGTATLDMMIARTTRFFMGALHAEPPGTGSEISYTYRPDD